VRISRIAGLLLVLVGLLVNKWTLEIFVVPDGAITTTLMRSVIAAAEFLVVAAGVWMYVAAPRFPRPTVAQWTLLVVSTTLSLTLVEVTLRLQPGLMSVPDAFNQRERDARSHFEPSEIGWRMVPSHTFEMTVERTTSSYISNAQGFRSPHDFSQPAAATIALVGDSFTWGWGVDYPQTFAARLEQRLVAGRVNDYGMPGFGIDQIWQSTRTQALPVKPALVVVGFIDDDFSRSLYPIRPEEGFPKPRFELSGGELKPQPPRDSLLQHSAVWRLVDDSFLRVRPFGEWWALNTAFFDAMGRDCAQQGVPVVFVRLPQIDGSAFPSLARHFRHQGLAYIDLGESSPEEDLHYQEDRHLNARGHARVASMVADWISAHQPGLLK
jgi:hypothetical protein